MIAQNQLKFFVLALTLTIASACSSKSGGLGKEVEPTTPIAPVVIVDESGTLPSGQRIQKSATMFAAEATLTDSDYQQLLLNTSQLDSSDRQKAISDHISGILSQLQKVGAVPVYRRDEVAFFTVLLPFQSNVDLFAAVRALDMDAGKRIVLNPVVYDPNVLKDIRALKPSSLELAPRGGAHSSNGFSGLERMGAIEFVKQAESALGDGTKVNGSDVTVGVTDTGITYNHPSFRSANGQNRIVYMKDFTGEGFIYFPATANFAASAGTTPEELIVSAEVAITPRLPARPTGDKLTPINNLKIRVSAEQREKILAPGAIVKLGYLNEDSMQAEGEQVDINANGKLNDKLYLLLVQGAKSQDDVIYFDSTGTADFRRSPALGDWNATKAMIDVFAEKIGFTIEASTLDASDGVNKIDARKVAFVGFDPGNHGSHVTGIIAGLKTIANDPAQTLARGVAPEARIASNRVCANNGGCGATEAIVDLALNGKAEVINMSLGGLGPFNDGYGVQETVINRLTMRNNVLFVISAGNSGPGKQTVGSPSTARFSLSVGAAASREMINRQYQWPGAGASTGDDDFMLFFSSRGPTAAGGFKPNIAAPGTELSAIQLNAPAGVRGGLDVYWGTSMSAPAATGAYALLLDAIKKYNAKNPGRELTTNAVSLRQILIDTARPFDVTRFDPITGEKSTGQYTWADQGTGMVNLVAAWKRLFEARDNTLPTAVTHNGKPVELDYQALISLKGPNGIAYDGSRPSAAGVPPAFGTGLYLDFSGTETLRTVNIQRKLPDALAASPDAGSLSAQLETTRDEFELRTVFYGSEKEWLKPGVYDQLPCMSSETSRLSVIGKGVGVTVDKDGKATLAPFPASVLNVCLDRQIISNELAPGDHGALIYGYRAVGSLVASVPSFVVPVYVTVPHKTLGNSKGYELDLSVRSFGVNRNYVVVPAGTSVVTVTLEVPAAKLDAKGQVITDSCAGVELMSLEGGNTTKSFKTRPEARAQSCDATGAAATKTKVSFTRSKPTAGIWDLHIFGQYKFVNSTFKLKVDYVTGKPSVDKIEGTLAALTGSFDWNLVDSSTPVTADAVKSTIEISTLEASTADDVVQDQQKLVGSPLGLMRQYPAGTKSVTITTGESPGNDLDIIVYECPVGHAKPDATCSDAGQSGGPADNESVTFVPKAGKSYGLVVHGYTVKASGAFVSYERILQEAEKGTIAVSGASPAYVVDYTFTPEQLAASKLVTHPLFAAGTYRIIGSLTLRTPEGVSLDVLPIRLKQ